jgi:hypothetical protein
MPGDTRPPVPYDSAASMYEKAQVTYEMDASKLQVPISVARVEGQLVSYQQVPSAIQNGATLGRLEIEYPHPRGREGFALARVTIESKFNEGSQERSLASRMPVVGKYVDPPTQVEEVWELDIPRGQFDRVVAQLNNQRYFDRGTGGSGPVKLQTRVDGYPVNKTWERVAELDQLMVAVRTYGHLVTYHRTPTTDKVAGPPPASIAAYRAYAQQDARYGPSTSQYVASGYTLPGVSANPATGYGVPPGRMVAAQPAQPGNDRIGKLPNPAPTVR